MTDRNRINSAQRGVSLVEILVVLMIAAMVAGIVIWNAPPLRDEALTEGERFAARLAMASQQAVTRGDTIGLEIADASYRFYRYDRGEWKNFDSPLAKGGAFPSDLAIAVKFTDAAEKNERSQDRDETDERPHPNIVFTPTGEATPFEITFRAMDNSVVVAVDGAGKVEVKRHDEAQ